MSKVIKVLISIFSVIIVLGSIGGGLYFGGVFNRFFSKEKKTISFDKVDINFNTNSNINDTKREFSFNCNFTLYTTGQVARNKPKSELNQGPIVCIYQEKVGDKFYDTNMFPIIIFRAKKIGELLIGAQLEKESKDQWYQRLRTKAKGISKSIVDTISFGPEIALLDEIVFSSDNITSGDSLGVYETEKNDDVLSLGLKSSKENEVTMFKQSRRSIRIKVTPDMAKGDDGKFDKGELLATLSHEYGHHVTLYNKELTASIFLNKLKELFDKNGTDFASFEKIYKYFNNLNKDELNNYKILSEYKNVVESKKNKIRENLANVLSEYRKKYSGNVINLYDELESENDDEKIVTINGILDSFKSSNRKLPLELKNKLDEVIKDRSKFFGLKDYLKSNTYMFYYIDFNQVLHLNSINKIKRVFYLMPSTFQKDFNEQQHSLLVKDIFKWTDIKNVNKNFKDNSDVRKINNSCGNLPINFATLGHVNFEASLFRDKFKSQKSNEELDYKEVSKDYDLFIAKKLSYFYSKEELLARLFSVLTYRYERKRSLLPTCAFDYSINTKQNSEKEIIVQTASSSSTELYSDYSIFAAFKMNVLNPGISDKLYRLFIGIDKLNNQENNRFFIFTNNRKLGHEEKTKPKSYFLSFNRLNKSKITKFNWLSIYLSGIAKVASKQRFNVWLEYDYNNQKYYRRPMTYNYIHYKHNVFSKDSREYDLNLLETQKVLEKEVGNEKINVGLVYPLTNIFGQIDIKEGFSSFDNNSFHSIKDVDKTFNHPTKVFVDMNNDGKYTANVDELLSKIIYE